MNTKNNVSIDKAKNNKTAAIAIVTVALTLSMMSGASIMSIQGPQLANAQDNEGGHTQSCTQDSDASRAVVGSKQSVFKKQVNAKPRRIVAEIHKRNQRRYTGLFIGTVSQVSIRYHPFFFVVSHVSVDDLKADYY